MNLSNANQPHLSASVNSAVEISAATKPKQHVLLFSAVASSVSSAVIPVIGAIRLLRRTLAFLATLPRRIFESEECAGRVRGESQQPASRRLAVQRVHQLPLLAQAPPPPSASPLAPACSRSPRQRSTLPLMYSSHRDKKNTSIVFS